MAGLTLSDRFVSSLKELVDAKNMYEAVKTPLMYMRVIGLVSFRVEGKTTKKILARGSIVATVWTFCLFTTYVLSTIINFTLLENFLDQVYASNIRKYCDALQKIFNVVATMTAYIAGYYNRSNYIKTFDDLAEVDAMLKSIGCEFDYSLINVFCIILTIGHFVINIGHGFFVYFTFTYFNKNQSLPVIINDCFVVFMDTVVVLQFLVSVVLIAKRFTSLNDRLNVLTKDFTKNSTKKNIVYVKDFNISPKIKNKYGYAKFLDSKITYISKVHAKLCETCGRVNTIHGIPILVLIGKSFATIVFSIFYLVEGISSLELDDLSGIFLFVFSTGKDILISLGIIFVIVLICSICVGQASKTVHVIQWFLLYDDDGEILQKLMGLTMQLWFLQPQFTAFGFFTLDYTLLFTVIGSATTYLIILIQFATSPANAKFKTPVTDIP